MNKKILVFIPTYNCQNQIGRVLSQFDKQIQKLVTTILIVDNLSRDNTVLNAKNSGKKIYYTNLVVIRNDKNYGLGGSHKVAFNYAKENRFDYLIVLHGDDQASIKDLLPYIQKKIYKKYDCILGSRFMRYSYIKGYSKIRTYGNIFYNNLFSYATSFNIKDLGSGLNLYNIKKINTSYINKFPDDLTFNYIMLIASISKGFSIKYIPISWREEDQLSNVRLFSQGLKVLFMLFKFFLYKNKFLRSEMRNNKYEKYFGYKIHEQLRQK